MKLKKKQDLINTAKEKEIALEKAKRQADKLVFEGGRYVYKQDSEAIESAQKEYDDAITAILEYNSDEQITLLEEQR